MVPMGPQRAAASGGRGNARSICPMPAPRRPPPALPVVFISDPPRPTVRPPHHGPASSPPAAGTGAFPSVTDLVPPAVGGWSRRAGGRRTTLCP